MFFKGLSLLNQPEDPADSDDIGIPRNPRTFSMELGPLPTAKWLSSLGNEALELEIIAIIG